MTGFSEVMNPRKRLRLTIFIIPLLHVILPATAATAYNATDIILLDCGALANTTSTLDGRIWEADTRSKYSSFNHQSSSFPSNASRQDTSVPQVPYLSALIIQSNFTYSFPVSPGPKFLRLYFYPEKYSNLDMTASFFSVTANSYTLLNNFSAHLTVSAMRAASLIKEFIVTVRDNERLNVTFTPSPNSQAFINAIEIVSMPSLLYTRGDDIIIPVVTADGTQVLTLDDTTALETVYRLNVGGKQVESMEDTGMYRTWRQDEGYLAGRSGWTIPLLTKYQLRFSRTTQPYTAPDKVYTSARQMSNDPSFNMKTNMTWIFPVDAGFSYLVRLHFCELWKQVTGSGQHVFHIFINKQTAATFVDVFDQSGGYGFPMFKDYIVMADSGIKGKDLTLELHPQNATFVDAFLNGLEIFKLSQTNGNLAGPNPDPSVSPPPPDSRLRLPKNPKSEVMTTILPIVGAIIGGFALFSFLLGLFIFQRRRKLKDSISSASKFSITKTSSSLPSDLCRHFSIAQIKAATQDFDDQFLIGSGGFGNVYRGIIDGVTTTVAIKRLDSSSRQGAHEFHTEITMLSKLRHMHLVSLTGYCDDHGEMVLVYDYMPRGTLRDHLYQTKNPPLSWKQRLEICIGAARGLHYLHKEAKHCIIHRDVKSSNILLDENYVAKVSDFGLSKLGPTSTSQTHVSTVVKGSLGYVDPEYYLRQRLTEKSDVYSFGVVLFEVLCGRPPMIQGLSKEKANLAHWASSCYLKGLLDQIIDPCLKGQIAPMALQKFGEVAEKCVRNQGMERPTMSDIVWALEFTLQLQETVDGNTNSSSATPNDNELFSGSSETAAKAQQSVSDTTCSITVGDLSSETKISEKDTSKLLFGDDN